MPWAGLPGVTERADEDIGRRELPVCPLSREFLGSRFTAWLLPPAFSVVAADPFTGLPVSCGLPMVPRDSSLFSGLPLRSSLVSEDSCACVAQ